MKASALWAFLLLLSCRAEAARSQTDTLSEASLPGRADNALARLVQLQQELKDIHPYLSVRQPIAIVEGGELYIFDNDPSFGRYKFQKEEVVREDVLGFEPGER